MHLGFFRGRGRVAQLWLLPLSDKTVLQEFYLICESGKQIWEDMSKKKGGEGKRELLAQHVRSGKGGEKRLLMEQAWAKWPNFYSAIVWQVGHFGLVFLWIYWIAFSPPGSKNRWPLHNRLAGDYIWFWVCWCLFSTQCCPWIRSVPRAYPY